MLSTSIGLAVALAGAGGVRTLVADLLVGAGYEATEVGAEASVIFTAKTDGTWEITFGSGDLGSGTPLTGTWLPSGTAADYEVKYTPTNQVGSPTINNGAAVHTAMSANRSCEVLKSGANASSDLLIEFRRAADISDNVSDTTNFAANGAP